MKPGLFITTTDQYAAGRLDGYVHILGRDVAAALAANGWACEAVTLQSDPQCKAIFEGGWPPFVLALNLLPFVTIAVNLPTGKTVLMPLYRFLRDVLNVPVICILGDHAAHPLKYFTNYLPYSGGSPKPLPQFDVIAFASLEPSSFPFLEGIAVPPSKMICLPWGGPLPASDPKPFKSRKHQLFFQGSLGELESKREFAKRCKADGMAPPVARGLLRAAERVAEENKDLHAVILAEMKKEGIDPARLHILDFAKMIGHVDMRARTIRRGQFLSAFAKLPVHFFGNYPENFHRKFPRARFHGPKPFGEVMDFADDTKIALCESVNFRKNVHMRLPYSMAQGCLVVAEKNIRLGGDFTDMKNIIFSDHPYRGAAEKVEAVLTNPRLGQDMIEAAHPIYQNRYTWRETVKVLAPFLPPPAR